MRNAGEKIGSILGCLFALPNVFAGIVGFFWLAIIGEWRIMGCGIVLSLVMPYLYSLVSLPTLIVVPFLLSATEKGQRLLAAMLGLIVGFYEKGLLAAWVLIVFNFFRRDAGPGTYIPFLMWGYATAMSPLIYMASKDLRAEESLGTMMGLILAEIAYLSIVGCWYAGASFQVVIIVLLCLLLIATILPVIAALAVMKEEERQAAFWGSVGQPEEEYDEVDF